MPRRIGSAAAWALVAMAVVTPRVACQERPERPWRSNQAAMLALGDPRLTASLGGPDAAPGPQLTHSLRPSTVTLLSLGLPGAGQHVLGQRRKWLYLALEAVAWTLYLERRGAAHGYRDRYRDFAWEHARLQGPARVEADFGYYETLTKWSRSGAFDSDDVARGLQPEQDSSTFNGSVWSLARRIYLSGGVPPQESDPEYQNALGYYQERAYGPPFLWDWSGNADGRQELAELIEASDDRFRQATTALGAVLANHLLSAVDAYVSARGLLGAARLRVEPNQYRAGARWSAVLSVAVR